MFSHWNFCPGSPAHFYMYHKKGHIYIIKTFLNIETYVWFTYVSVFTYKLFLHEGIRNTFIYVWWWVSQICIMACTIFVLTCTRCGWSPFFLAPKQETMWNIPHKEFQCLHRNHAAVVTFVLRFRQHWNTHFWNVWSMLHGSHGRGIACDMQAGNFTISHIFSCTSLSPIYSIVNLMLSLHLSAASPMMHYMLKTSHVLIAHLAHGRRVCGGHGGRGTRIWGGFGGGCGYTLCWSKSTCA